MEEWAGDSPDPEQRLGRAAAEKHLIDRAAEREKVWLRRQVAEACLRLQRELGGYPACLGEGTNDLNGLFHRQMTRDIATAQRLRRCLEKFGGYPDWEPGLCRELEKSAQGLTDSQCKARLLGKEIDASLDAPRWIAEF